MRIVQWLGFGAFLVVLVILVAGALAVRASREM